MRHGENHVRMQALYRAPPPQQPTPSVVKPEGRPAASVKPGQESCVIKSISAYTLSARSLVKHLEGDEASDQNHVGVTNVARHRYANRRIPVSHKYPQGI